MHLVNQQRQRTGKVLVWPQLGQMCKGIEQTAQAIERANGRTIGRAGSRPGQKAPGIRDTTTVQLRAGAGAPHTQQTVPPVLSWTNHPATRQY
jgi:hypothetical protein